MRIMGMTSLATFLISLINHIFSSHVYYLTVHFIGGAIFLLPQCSASRTHTLSLCLSAILLSFTFFLFDIKNPGKPFHLIIVGNKLFLFTPFMFHLRGLHTILLLQRVLTRGPLNKILTTKLVFTTLCFLRTLWLRMSPVS